jgi:protein CpxP
MKNIILTAAFALTLTGVAAFAQTSDPAQQNTIQQHAHDPHRAAMRMAQQLNLTPDQTAKLEPILAARQQKMEALRADTSLSDTQRKTQMHTIQQGTRLQLANVLSPDQMKQLKQMRHKHGEQEQAPSGV